MQFSLKLMNFMILNGLSVDYVNLDPEH